MDDRELEALLTDLESDRVERKASLADRDRIREAICAFANDLPGHGLEGVVFVGARQDGSCASLPITDELLLNLAHMRDDGLTLPIPSMTVEKRCLRGFELAVVAVQPAIAPPVRFRGRVWIRVGPRRAIATPEEERRLAERRRAGDLPFDLRPLPSASPSDLDLDLFARTYLPAAVSPDVLEHNRRSPDDQLKALRLLDPAGLPTVLGMLAVGKDPRRHIPGAYVQFLRLEGTRLSDPIRDQKEIDGPLPDLLRRLDEVTDAHNAVATSITTGPIEVRRPEYPLPAIQQVLRNAVLHRTYEGTNAPVHFYWFSDRIEVLSPGGPFGLVNASNFGHAGIADYRNLHLAVIMKDLGYVQRFGVGIEIARAEMARNGNPPPEFEVTPTFILAVLRRAT